jgi:hypothetical protein
MRNYQDGVRQEKLQLDLHELLREPVTALLGVTKDAGDALAPLGIHSVFDLGISWLFSNARAAARLGRSEDPATRFSLAPSDLFVDGANVDLVNGAADAPVGSLRGLTASEAQELERALDVSTVRDLAYWPPHAFARALVEESFGATLTADELQTELLRPRFGDHPTERVYYSTLVMLHMDEQANDDREDLSGPVSLAGAVATKEGFTNPAIGALVTYSQSWYAQGLTLGQLLHSLALAPGEATRIAVVDWSRRTRATATESISETEQLDSATSHARAMSEVQRAVADEFQQGGSTSTTTSTSESGSVQASVGTGLLTSLWASGDISASYQSASTESTATSSSWSLGKRSVAAEMAQNINDRTEQHSTSVRNRRATAVREVSQSEHEEVSTRIVANYNHMHALTVQYYEVVQVYRVATELRRVERCLFVPFELLDFNGQSAMDVVDRFRGALLAASLTRRVRDLLLDDTSAVEVKPTSVPVRVETGPAFSALSPMIAARSLTLRTPLERGVAVAGVAASAATGAAATAESRSLAGAIASTVWDREALAHTSRYVPRPLLRPGSDSLYLPDDAELLAIAFEGTQVDKVRLDRSDPNAADDELTMTAGRIDLRQAVRLGDLDGIHASRPVDSAASGRMVLTCVHLGRRFTLPPIPVALNTSMGQIASFTTDQANRRKELLAHLQANRAHYTAAVLRSLDSASLVLLLSRFTWNGAPLIDQVEPKPLRIAGNFMVLRAPADADDRSGVVFEGSPLKWGDLTEQRGLVRNPPDARIVPIPTSGVFAEAVLGRSNSAEKLEYTRFWNWQDSPIPLQPTEISPVAMGSRGQPEDLRPGQLGQPVLNIVNPTALPDPTGVGAVLQAVASGNMFRDMSGLAGTQTLAGQALEGTLEATTDAARITSENMKAQMQKAVAMGQIAADIAKSAMAAYAGVPAGGGGANQTVSAEAARVAHGEKIDREAGARARGGASGSPEEGVIEIGGAGSGAPSLQTASFAPALDGADGAPPGAGGAAFMRALHGPLGMPVGQLAAAGMRTIASLGAGGAAAPASTGVSPFATSAYPPIMSLDAPRTTALKQAIANERAALPSGQRKSLDKLAIAIAKLDGGGTVDYVGVREEHMLFSGSLLKVAILYASFELRERVRTLAPNITAANGTDFLAEVAKAFQPGIDSAIARVPAGARRRVKFGEVLTATPSGSGFDVDFTKKHLDDLRKTFSSQGQNTTPNNCILRLGFSYINGALLNGGFLDLSAKKGIWLGGMFGSRVWDPVFFPTANGGASSQCTAALAMTRLLAAVQRGELISSAVSTEMLDILQPVSWLNSMGSTTVGLSYTIPRAKVGHALQLFSEGGIAQRGSTRYAFTWQNLNDALPIDSVYRLMDEVIKTW